MTAREILDAFRSGLEETSRRLAKGPYTNGQLTQMRPQAAQRDATGGKSLEARREKEKL
jgi:hypothetical protein